MQPLSPARLFYRHGFSLVELSIVLVILGLLVGGLLTGQALVRAAQLNALIKENQNYRAAINTFRDKYQGLPGDLANATSFWQYAGVGGCTNNTGAATNSAGTCDGDGSGFIMYGMTANASGEAFQAWRQLSLAGLIEGSYSGLAASFTDTVYDAYAGRAIDYNYGVNAPKSRIDGVGWGLTYFDNSSGWNNVYVFQNDYRNWFNVGKDDDGRFADAPFLKPEEAWSIDTKLDDGKPRTGIIHARPECVSGANFNLALTTQACALLFKQ